MRNNLYRATFSKVGLLDIRFFSRLDIEVFNVVSMGNSVSS